MESWERDNVQDGKRMGVLREKRQRQRLAVGSPALALALAGPSPARQPLTPSRHSCNSGLTPSSFTGLLLNRATGTGTLQTLLCSTPHTRTHSSQTTGRPRLRELSCQPSA